MRSFFLSLSIVLLITEGTPVFAGDLKEFSLVKLNGQSEAPTLLVIGGIQGDEPGGFHAASILSTHYTITKGNVWVVPNLNFLSIIKRSRGIHGDLNRKFAAIKKDDPEYIVVQRIKSIILNESVDLILNLHDGSGFYRKHYIDKNNGPHRWGQSIIIDQRDIDAPRFSNLSRIAEIVTRDVNTGIKKPHYQYHVKNTRTAEGNVEMAKTLTYFAITNGKPAFGVEASKTLPKSERVYYHLLVLESFMKNMGISFKRKFPLNVAGVEKTIKENRAISFYDSRIFMEMADVRNTLRYFPLDKSNDIDFWTRDPLLTVVEEENTRYQVFHGNERITTLDPQFFDYDTTPPQITIEVDGITLQMKMGDMVNVSESFRIYPKIGYRANAIGFTAKNVKDESGIRMRREDFRKHYSLNRGGNVFRVEFYKVINEKKKATDKFAGMILIKFDQKHRKTRVATARYE